MTDYPFTTDGCSGGMTFAWKLFTGRTPPWNGACVAHDRSYWRGGNVAQRKIADADLLIDVARNGYPVWGFLMYAAVRVGGVPWLPTPWRWGYGYRYPRRAFYS